MNSMNLDRQRMMLAPQVWGSRGYAGYPTESAFFAFDHWAHEGRHSVFLQTYEPLKQDEHLEAGLNGLATSALWSILGSLSRADAPPSIDLSTFDWYFVLATRREMGAWAKVEFAEIYANRIHDLKVFPETNDVLLLEKPSYSWVPDPRTAHGDENLGAYEYRWKHLQAARELADLLDNEVGQCKKVSTWHPSHEGMDIDCGSLTLAKQIDEHRMLFASHSEKALEEAMAEMLKRSPEAKVLGKPRKMASGFYGAALSQSVTTTWDFKEGPQPEWTVSRVNAEFSPTWKGSWRTPFFEKLVVPVPCAPWYVN